MGPVLAVVLAAGGSTRMGRPKNLAPLEGRPLLAHALAALDTAPVDRVVVALGGAAGEVLDRVGLGRAEALGGGGWWLGTSGCWCRAGRPPWATSWPPPWPRPARTGRRWWCCSATSRWSRAGRWPGWSRPGGAGAGPVAPAPLTRGR